MWLLGWAGEDWRPDKLGLVVEGNPQSPDLVVVTEAWPDAHKSDKAQEVLYTLRVQVPCVVVCPWGHVSDDPSTPDLMLMDPPAWVLARMRSVSPQAKPRDSR